MGNKKKALLLAVLLALNAATKGFKVYDCDQPTAIEELDLRAPGECSKVIIITCYGRQLQ